MIGIPIFDPDNPLHTQMATLSQQAHQLTALGKEGEEQLRRVEEEIDRKAAELWGLTEDELKQIQTSLKEIS